jgi:hypothetical protein
MQQLQGNNFLPRRNNNRQINWKNNLNLKKQELGKIKKKKFDLTQKRISKKMNFIFFFFY